MLIAIIAWNNKRQKNLSYDLDNSAIKKLKVVWMC